MLKGFLQAEEKYGWMKTMRNSTVPQNSQSGAGELSKAGLGAKSSLLTVCGVYWTSATPTHLHTVYGSFCAKITELSCDRDLIWHLRGTNKKQNKSYHRE